MEETVHINLKKLVNWSQLEERFCRTQVKDLRMTEGQKDEYSFLTGKVRIAQPERLKFWWGTKITIVRHETSFLTSLNSYLSPESMSE